MRSTTWRGNTATLANQIYVFAKQHDRMFHLKGKVDVIITDSPLLLGLMYADWTRISRSFEALVVDEFCKDDAWNVNVLLKRVKKYSGAGRTQTEEESIGKDGQIRGILDNYGIPYYRADGDEGAVAVICGLVNDKLRARHGQD